MFRFIIPIIIIGIAVTGFMMFTTPLYQEVSSLKGEVASYNDALNNSKALENARDKLTAEYNAISLEDLDRLKKLLPDNIDNIRLILEIEKIASPYGMVLKDVQYSSDEQKSPTGIQSGDVVQGGALIQESQKPYGTWNLQFSVSGTYSDFMNFTRDLETNLRIVDISSVTFSSDVDAKSNPRGIYTYTFNIKTYWLR